MDNSPRLPIVSIMIAVGLGLIAGASYFSRPAADVPVLTEMELGAVAAGLALAIFGIQGLISVLIEGRQLHPGIVRPRLTNPLSLAIVASSMVLFVTALVLAYGILEGWGPIALGSVAGAGCVILATLLIFYKEAFLGDEVSFDDREDGVPW